MKTKTLKRLFSLVMAVTMLFTMNSLPMFTAHADEPECEYFNEYGEHWYEYDCQQYCSYCGEARETECDHYYEYNCEEYCNDCGESIESTEDHVYDEGGCDQFCNNCDEERETDVDHQYNYSCSTMCAYCQEQREAEAQHTYSSECDIWCDVCDEWREAEAGHTYDDDCDYDCNQCFEYREAPHNYSNCFDYGCDDCDYSRDEVGHKYYSDCDADCDVCGFEREVEGHQYDYDCSEYCNICGEWRDIEGHQYDNDCDEDCNYCGEIREVYHSYEWGCERYCNICNAELVPEYDHEYYSDCASKCMNCGEERDEEEITADHVYDEEYPCTTECQNCFEKRVNDTPHEYSYNCDEYCDVCNEYRSVEHTYTDECDDECDVEGCGAWREAPHYVDSFCDDECNMCGAYIEATHYFDDDCDAYCENCELTREPPHYYENGCDDCCDLCGETRVVEGHQYDNDCDEYCNNCNEHREGEHDFDENGFCKNSGCYQMPEFTTDKYDIDENDAYDEVYEIKNAGNLYWFAQYVNTKPEGMEYEETENQRANAVLLNNIVINENVIVDGELSENASNFKNWTPIGKSEWPTKVYYGHFDGMNHTISGIYCNNPDGSRIGLFGASMGYIENVGIVDSYFNGDSVVGSVCGYNCRGEVDRCYNNGCLVIGNSAVGGISGANCYGANMFYCYNTGTVVGDSAVGGIVGDNSLATETDGVYYYPNVSECYNVGSVNGKENVGGICGANNAEMHNGYVATSDITGDENVGAICGYAGSDSVIDGWYYDCEIYTGSAFGTYDSDDGESAHACTTEQFEKGEVCYCLNSGITDEENARWRQTIGSDSTPKLFVGGIVYPISDCGGNPNTYSNEYVENPPHKFDDDNDNECNVCEKQRIIGSITYKDIVGLNYLVIEKHTMVEDAPYPDVPSVTGYTFIEWSMDPDYALEKALGGEDVVVTPLYENKNEFYDTTAFCVGIDGELGINPLSTHTRRAGTMAQFEAIEIDGYTFIGWASSADATEPDLGTSNTYEVKVVQDKSVYALYSQTEVLEEKPMVAITDKGVVTEYGYEELFFTATRSIPDGFTLVEYGILAAKTEETGTEDNLIIGGEGVLQKKGQLNDNGAFTLFVNIDGDYEIVIYARGYLIYEKDGEQITVYSDIESGSFDTLSITVEEDFNA